MIIAAAQTKPKRGDVKSNLIDHYKMIDLASEKGAELIVFPEMSITGYERDRAMNLAFSERDARLDELRAMSANRNIIVIAGAPVLVEHDLYIGAYIIKPDRTLSIYTKQFLHEGEDLYFKSSSKYNPKIKLGDENISIAICADIDHPVHPENAKKSNTTLYLSSIFFTPNGIPGSYATLSAYAKMQEMNVLMSNFCGQSWGIEAGGKSAFWDKNGRLIAQLNRADAGVLLLEKDNNSWKGSSLVYD